MTTFNVTLSLSFLARESSQCFSFGLGVLFLCLVFNKCASLYCFYVEIHAEFSCTIAISKRENVGGMVIDRYLVTKFFLAMFVRDL